MNVAAPIPARKRNNPSATMRIEKIILLNRSIKIVCAKIRKALLIAILVVIFA
jgi:hypothetical protein